MRLVFSQRFRNELQREYELLRKENPEAARRLVERIVKSCRQLRDLPCSGRVGRRAGAWEWMVPGTRYAIAYDIAEDRIELLMLSHPSHPVSHVF